ncbi:hypothetical protein NDU88_002294, partial [Pleurodeles waltl]
AQEDSTQEGGVKGDPRRHSQREQRQHPKESQNEPTQHYRTDPMPQENHAKDFALEEGVLGGWRCQQALSAARDVGVLSYMGRQRLTSTKVGQLAGRTKRITPDHQP